MSKRNIILSYVVGILAIIMLTWVYKTNKKEQALLNKYGKHVKGIITKTVNRKRGLDFKYRFFIQNHPYEGWKKTYKKVYVGDSIEIIYYPNDPKISKSIEPESFSNPSDKKRYEPILSVRNSMDTILFGINDSLSLNFVTDYSSNGFLKHQYGVNSDDVIFYRNKEAEIKIKEKGKVIFTNKISKKDFKEKLDLENYESVYLSEIVFKEYNSSGNILFQIFLYVPDSDVRFIFEYIINQRMETNIKLIE